MEPRTRALVLVVLIGVVGLGCTRKDPPPTASDAGPSPIASSPRPAIDAGGALSTSARATALRDLDEGRRLSRAKDWVGATKAFERALAVSPDDPRILSELGWAAFNANDLTRAESANTRALANTKAPLVRAPILYNVGRVAEAKGNHDAARKAYRDSLALRDNAEVKKRLAALATDAASDSEERHVACTQSFAHVPALCRCLTEPNEDQLFVPDFEKRVCNIEGTALLGDGHFGVVAAGGDVLGEKVHVLIAREAGRVRVVAELGRDYEPGAFGVHNAARVNGGHRRTVNGHTVVVVRSQQDDDDLNMAGLELCFYHAKLETICALSETAGETRCTPAIPIEVTSGCGPGVKVDPKELDDSTRQAVAEIEKNKTHNVTKTAWTIAEDGTVTVTLTEGSRDVLAPAVLRPTQLWR